MFVQYTLLIYVLLLLYALLSHSRVWHLLHVVYTILNMPRYAFSAAGQTCSYRHSDKAANDEGRQLISLPQWQRFIFTTYLGSSIVLMRHHWRDCYENMWKIAMKICGLQQDFVTWNIY